MFRKWILWGTILLLSVLAASCAGGRSRPIGDCPPAPPPTEGARYDVIVFGGQPEGIAAAVAAARQGLSVLLVEEREGLGGLFTYGWLNFLDMNYGPQHELLTRGTFLEFYKRIGKSPVFDVEEAKGIFQDMVSSHPNIALSLNTRLVEPLLQGEKLVGIRVKRDGQELNLYAERFIDASADADLAAAAGVPYTVGAEDMGEPSRCQAATLIFQLGNIDWETLTAAVKGGQFEGTKINERAAWGFAQLGKKYQPSTPRLRLRGLNVARQKDGSVLINALQIFYVNGLEEASKKEALELARKELPAITSFLKKNLPGFEKAELLGSAPELYIRETRHIKALYQLDINDVVFNRYFPDAIALGSYPVDVQATSPQDTGYVYGRPVVYSIPFRCLVPVRVENLLVVGRSAGYTHLAAGSARVVPVGMATADAAGVACAHSLKTGRGFKEIALNSQDVVEIQKMLKDMGGYIRDYKIPNPLEKHWAFESLKFVNRWGLIVAGYDNDWGLDKPIKPLSFYYMTANALRRAAGREDLVRERSSQLESYLREGTLTRAEAARLLLAYQDPSALALKDEEAVGLAKERGLLPTAYMGRDPHGVVKGAEAYYATRRLCEMLAQK